MTRDRWDMTLTWMTERHNMPPLEGEDRERFLDCLTQAFGPGTATGPTRAVSDRAAAEEPIRAAVGRIAVPSHLLNQFTEMRTVAGVRDSGLAFCRGVGCRVAWTERSEIRAITWIIRVITGEVPAFAPLHAGTLPMLDDLAARNNQPSKPYFTRSSKLRG